MSSTVSSSFEHGPCSITSSLTRRPSMFSTQRISGQVILGTVVSWAALSQAPQPFSVVSLFRSVGLRFSSSGATNMSPAQIYKPFEVPSLGPLHIGQTKKFTANGSNGPTMREGMPWALPAGVYTPKQIVEANAPLLETVLHHLGESPKDEPSAREQLIDNLASNLALGTREASIEIPTRDASRTELAQQAEKIGKKLISYVRNVTDVTYDPKYVVRSPCENHLLKPHVSWLMFGPRSLRHLMQIYNEYLHQMVLLRDSLLPFENYEEVLIPIVPGPKRGIRYVEETRLVFLTEVLTKQSTAKTLLRTAQAFLAPTLTTPSQVGFQYKAGSILPAFIAGGSSKRLLRYVPAVFDSSLEQISFQYGIPDYDAAERGALSYEAGTPVAKNTSLRSAVLEATGDKTSHFLQLTLDWEDKTLSFDFGQIARGARYATYVNNKSAASSADEALQISIHDARAILDAPQTGLILPPPGVHVVQAASYIESLAVLGRLYPDNIVVMSEAGSVEQALKAGKAGFPDAGRFVVSVAKA